MSIARPKSKASNSNCNRGDGDKSLALARIYTDYCIKNPGIDGARFLKFCKDANLFTDSYFRIEDVDLIFAKFKEKAKRYLNFEGFTSALVHIAAKKNMSTENMLEYIIDICPSFQPSSATTFAMPTRFHDDVRTYTGVHKAGGPTIIDMNHRDLAQMVDREIKSNMEWQLENGLTALKIHENSPRLRSTNNSPVHCYQEGSPRTVTNYPLSPIANIKGTSINSAVLNHVNDHNLSPREFKSHNSSPDIFIGNSYSNCFSQELKVVFNNYCVKNTAIPKGGIDGAKFLKLCRDVYLFDSDFRPQDLDVIFAKYKESGLRHMSYRGFIHSITEISNRKNIKFDIMVAHILHIMPSAQPTSATVTALPNRFHDDQSTYTGAIFYFIRFFSNTNVYDVNTIGVHKAGGPTNFDRNHINLSQIVNRAPGKI